MSDPDPDSDDAPPGLGRAGTVLLVATALISTAGLVAELLCFLADAPAKPVELFSLSYEKNVPTWYASSLLLGCAALLALTAHGSERLQSGPPTRWWVLSGVFAFMSLDEAIEIHEHLGGLLQTEGVLYFSWVVPASIVVMVFGASMWPLLRQVDAWTRQRFIGAAVLYVGGALLMELPLGYWTESHGDDNLVYGLLDWVEETCELFGAAWFAHTLARRLIPTARLDG